MITARSTRSSGGTSGETVSAHFPESTKLYNRSVRQIGKNDLLNSVIEYRMVLKVYQTKNIFGIITDGDYHFMVQCKNGTWTNKLSYLNSENLGNIDPSANAWNYGGINPNTNKREYGTPYNSNAIYFSVREW
jgi:hypothetical protein